MARPRTSIMDWVFDPEADETDEQCESTFRGFRCVAPVEHTSVHWAPDGLLPQVWWNRTTPYYRRVDVDDD